MRLQGSSLISQIILAEGKVPNRVQVLRVGKFSHPSYGKFEITTKTLAEMKKNFDDKVRGIDTAFDYFHASDKEASAWVKELVLAENGNELWAIVDWTPTAEKKLAERELRYFSPDFSFQWQDPESGKKFSNVLFGGGLTNRPFVKEMAAIVASEDKTMEKEVQKIMAEKGCTYDEAMNMYKTQQADKAAKDEEIKMNEEQVKEIQAKLSEVEAQLATEKANNAKLTEEKAAIEKKIELAEKETAFGLLLSEGKACAAQKDAFIKGDMNEFIKLAQPLNMKQQGNGATTEEKADDTSDTQDKILKLAEEKRTADPKLSVRDSIALASKEIK